MAKYDLLLTNGRILDPSQNIDSVADIAFKNGRVLEIAETLKSYFSLTKNHKSTLNLREI